MRAVALRLIPEGMRWRIAGAGRGGLTMKQLELLKKEIAKTCEKG